MDQFFDFHQVANHPIENGPRDSRNSVYTPFNMPTSTAYDIDLILAHAAGDDGSYNALQHCEIGPTNGPGFTTYTVLGTQMDGANKFHGFSSRMEGTQQPVEPCTYCMSHRLDCLVLGERALGYDGTCNSCKSLSRQCSFVAGKVSDGLVLKDSPHAYQGAMNPLVDNLAPMMDSYQLMSSNEAQISRMLTPSQREEGSEGSSRSSTRFSRETIRQLRHWLSLHHEHPYPTEEEKDDLQRKTGLTKVQITNWLANARRRGQVKPPKASPPSVQFISKPQAASNKSLASLENMDPMERWKNSPPEDEPAVVSAVTKAVTSTPTLASAQNSPHSFPRSDAGSGRSGSRASSISSKISSRSSGASFASAFSHRSLGSLVSFGKRGRRRRRHTSKPICNKAVGTPRQYQCTFCTETFKTKHDWQRHEKSLHLSLERWVCAPDLGKTTCEVNKCIFCGISNPDDVHYESHNHATCRERPLKERTFYRKDHLRQHLRLVHNCLFLPCTMDSWKVTAPEVRSRCGFCGVSVNTWSARIDHLAEHFKAGKSMAEWKGDWGFERTVLKLVENGMPPYLIHEKRMASMKAQNSRVLETPEKSRYDYIKASLLAFANQRASLGLEITDDDLRAAARRVYINKFEKDGDNSSGNGLTSWFGEVIICSDDALLLDDMAQKAAAEASSRIGPSYTPFGISDRVTVENCCELEKRLEEYVNSRRSLGLTPTDEELRAACGHIILEYDKTHSVVKSATAAIWFCNQTMSSSSWLTNFRRRLCLPPNPEAENQVSPESGFPIDASIHNYRKFENDMDSFVKEKMALGIIPMDADLQHQARLVILEFSDPFLQTAADDILWITRFKQRHGISNTQTHVRSRSRQSLGKPDKMTKTKSKSETLDNQLLRQRKRAMSRRARIQPHSPQDVKCWQRLETELSRFMASCMSMNSPNPHTPTDDEIQRQARWIVYNDNSPWNHTAADNPEWLLRLKCSNGIAPHGESSGISQTLPRVDMDFGGKCLTPSSLGSRIMLPTVRSNGRISPVRARSNDWSPPGQSRPHTPPVPHISAGNVFSSWNLESILATYASRALAQGYRPSDDDLRAQARFITGMPVTSADDPLLLEKFKETYSISYINVAIPNNIDMPADMHRISPGPQVHVGFSDAPMQAGGYERVDPMLWDSGSGLGGAEHGYIIR